MNMQISFFQRLDVLDNCVQHIFHQLTEAKRLAIGKHVDFSNALSHISFWYKGQVFRISNAIKDDYMGDQEEFRLQARIAASEHKFETLKTVFLSSNLKKHDNKQGDEP